MNCFPAVSERASGERRCYCQDKLHCRHRCNRIYLLDLSFMCRSVAQLWSRCSWQYVQDELVRHAPDPCPKHGYLRLWARRVCCCCLERGLLFCLLLRCFVSIVILLPQTSFLWCDKRLGLEWLLVVTGPDPVCLSIKAAGENCCAFLLTEALWMHLQAYFRLQPSA